MPGPVSGGSLTGGWFKLEQGFAKSALQILAGEAPGEQFAKGGVPSAEGVDSFRQFLEGGVVIRLEHLALDNREVNFNLIEPARIGWCVHDDDARMAGL